MSQSDVLRVWKRKHTNLKTQPTCRKHIWKGGHGSARPLKQHLARLESLSWTKVFPILNRTRSYKIAEPRPDEESVASEARFLVARGWNNTCSVISELFITMILSTVIHFRFRFSMKLWATPRPMETNGNQWKPLISSKHVRPTAWSGTGPQVVLEARQGLELPMTMEPVLVRMPKKIIGNHRKSVGSSWFISNIFKINLNILNIIIRIAA